VRSEYGDGCHIAAVGEIPVCLRCCGARGGAALLRVAAGGYLPAVRLVRKVSRRPYGTAWNIAGTVTQGFTLGYFRVLPDGRLEEPEGRWLSFVLFHLFRTEPGMEGLPVQRLRKEKARDGWARHTTPGFE